MQAKAEQQLILEPKADDNDVELVGNEAMDVGIELYSYYNACISQWVVVIAIYGTQKYTQDSVFCLNFWF